MDALNIAAGVATVLSFALSIWLIARERKTRALEEEKVGGYGERLALAAKQLENVAHHTQLIIEMSRRESTTIAELRHLAVCAAYDIRGVVATLRREERAIAEWVFGRVSGYAEPEHRPLPAPDAPPERDEKFDSAAREGD